LKLSKKVNSNNFLVFVSNKIVDYYLFLFQALRTLAREKNTKNNLIKLKNKFFVYNFLLIKKE
jgi:hypothetical protein